MQQPREKFTPKSIGKSRFSYVFWFVPFAGCYSAMPSAHSVGVANQG
jgi:hypothetical protein